MDDRLADEVPRSGCDLATLLADLDWLRALARRLAMDASAADDVVQEACTIALHQRRTPRHWRGWLIGVVKNLVRAERRTARRRALHLASIADATAPDAHSVVQRAELQHGVAAFVLRLDEPYRSTVLLRFFDGMPPRRIAALQGVPVATVHSRLQRALQQLRQSLDRELGGRERWLAAIVAIAWPGAAIAPRPGRRRLRVAAGAALVAVAGAVTWSFAGGDGARGRAGPGASAAVASRPPSEVAAAPERSAVTAPPAATHSYVVRGRVVDPRGVGVAGVRVSARREDHWDGVRIEPGELITDFATTVADGTFTASIDCPTAVLQVQDAPWASLLMGAWTSNGEAEPIIVVAPAAQITGVLVDPGGRPALDGRLALELPPGVFAALGVDLEGAANTSYHARAAPDGRFRFATLPCVEGARLCVSAAGCTTFRVPAPMASTDRLRIELPAVVAGPGDLPGSVVLADGQPAAGARVALGVTSVTADRDGRFVLRLQRAGRPTDLVAALPGLVPARIPVPDDGGDLVEDWPRPLVLRLGGPVGTLRGRVVDENGPVGGALVWIDDPSPFAVVGRVPLQLEYFIGGAPQVTRGRPLLPLDGYVVDDPRIDDAIVPGFFDYNDDPTASWQFVRTEADGAFVLPGALDRPYAVRAFHPASLRGGSVAGARTDAPVELALPQPDRRQVRGRVVSPSGRPLAGVAVRIDVGAFVRTTRVPEGLYRLTMCRSGPIVRTDADGRFCFATVPPGAWMLAFEGPTVMSGEADGTTVDTTRETTFVLEARCRFVFALADAAEADAVTFVDAEGRGIDARVTNLRNVRASAARVPLHDGRSAVVEVPETAVRVVLWRGEVRGREFPVEPTPGGITRVQ